MNNVPPYSARSPDLSPNQNLWDEPEYHVSSHPPTSTNIYRHPCLSPRTHPTQSMSTRVNPFHPTLSHVPHVCSSVISHPLAWACWIAVLFNFPIIPSGLVVNMWPRLFSFPALSLCFSLCRVLIGSPLTGQPAHRTGDVYKCPVGRGTSSSCTKLDLPGENWLHPGFFPVCVCVCGCVFMIYWEPYEAWQVLVPGTK